MKNNQNSFNKGKGSTQVMEGLKLKLIITTSRGGWKVQFISWNEVK